MSSGHWIKVLKGTPDKPELAEIRRWCGCSKAEAFLAFFELYCHFDGLTADGRIQFFRKEDVEHVTGFKHFADALEAVGWMTFDADGANVIDWEKHNGKSAKARMLHSERQNRYLAKRRD